MTVATVIAGQVKHIRTTVEQPHQRGSPLEEVEVEVEGICTLKVGLGMPAREVQEFYAFVLL